MRVLAKHQKKGEEGFTNYVKFLESSAPDKVKEVIGLGLLEDPVYLKWALANIMTFDYILGLGGEQIDLMCQEMPNSIPNLILALFGSPIEDQFINEKLSTVMRRKYQMERDFVKEVTRTQQEGARRTFYTVIRKLQDKAKIPAYPWKLPEAKILKGENFLLDKEGNFLSNYENGKPALKGKLKNKMRTGQWEHYYPNGTLMALGEYVNDDKMGKWVFYYSDGKKRSEGEYQENLRQGSWAEYDPSGNTKTVIYERGRPKD